jgi:hypothetical protein
MRATPRCTIVILNEALHRMVQGAVKDHAAFQ